MKCKDIREQLIELSAGAKGSAAVKDHLRLCPGCADQLSSMRRTMALLDEWQAPDASPYFATRLAARIRAEATAPESWWARIERALSPAGLFGRKAALATTLGVLFMAGILMFRVSHDGNSPLHTASSDAAVVAPVGTPVGDLEVLDHNHDLYADFDLLDDVARPDGQAVANE